MKLAITLFLGIIAIITMVFYVFGVLTNKWEYNFFDSLLLPVVGAIIIGVPVFGFIIILNFLDYLKTRILYFKIIKRYRSIFSFSLFKNYSESLRVDSKPTLLGNYKNYPLRFGYSLSNPLMISLSVSMRLSKLTELNDIVRKLKMKNKYFNGYGFSTELKRPFSKKTIENILPEVKNLINDFQIVLDKVKNKKAT